MGTPHADTLTPACDGFPELFDRRRLVVGCWDTSRSRYELHGIRWTTDLVAPLVVSHHGGSGGSAKCVGVALSAGRCFGHNPGCVLSRILGGRKATGVSFRDSSSNRRSWLVWDLLVAPILRRPLVRRNRAATFQLALSDGPGSCSARKRRRDSCDLLACRTLASSTWRLVPRCSSSE